MFFGQSIYQFLGNHVVGCRILSRDKFAVTHNMAFVQGRVFHDATGNLQRIGDIEGQFPFQYILLNRIFLGIGVNRHAITGILPVFAFLCLLVKSTGHKSLAITCRVIKSRKGSNRAVAQGRQSACPFHGNT